MATDRELDVVQRAVLPQGYAASHPNRMSGRNSRLLPSRSDNDMESGDDRGESRGALCVVAAGFEQSGETCRIVQAPGVDTALAGGDARSTSSL
jgi:hypothetical protein